MNPAGDSRSVRIATTAAEYSPHATHSGDRIWPETNCYVDLWIEVLHALGRDPVPVFASALSVDFDGDQWTFLKAAPEDLRQLYGISVTEENVWKPVLDTVESGLVRGMLHTVEVDSWWLPDTAGTDYRSGHVKTTIVATQIDRHRRTMTYLHNAGLHELSGDDFVGLFNLGDVPAQVLPPYVEQIRFHPVQANPTAALSVARAHLARRPARNPVDGLAEGVLEATSWLGAAGMSVFHLWAFATLRQCGATAELAADLSEHLETWAPGAAAAATDFRSVATTAKAIQFKMARVAMGRTVDVRPALGEMAAAWARAMDTMDNTVGAVSSPSVSVGADS
ncbi:DUF1839 family protein [Williamsia phyllosphaerae]|uniref:DUF1839 family protein n=1 Tax=Williamsia phyllosphaerae TaxID=885042 RepID=A0ABQ1UA25_9NOCA|nr:DUF1839 family protein [Williamsia phyllosphaerae]GGF12789.1 hypothetical protein GCM10007298_05880 [Williamsia phyllosphaerae]